MSKSIANDSLQKQLVHSKAKRDLGRAIKQNKVQQNFKGYTKLTETFEFHEFHVSSLKIYYCSVTVHTHFILTFKFQNEFNR